MAETFYWLTKYVRGANPNPVSEVKLTPEELELLKGELEDKKEAMELGLSDDQEEMDYIIKLEALLRKLEGLGIASNR